MKLRVKLLLSNRNSEVALAKPLAKSDASGKVKAFFGPYKKFIV